jgi:hypothetical protein
MSISQDAYAYLPYIRCNALSNPAGFPKEAAQTKELGSPMPLVHCKKLSPGLAGQVFDFILLVCITFKVPFLN